MTWYPVAVQTFGAYWGYCSAFPPYTCVFPPLGDAPLPPVPSPGPSLPPLPSVGTDALRALTTVTGQSFCADISPYVAGFGPGNEPSEAVVASVMDAIAASGRVKCVMTYGSQGASSFIPALAAARGIKVLQGAWLTEDPAANAIQYWGAKYLALAFPDIGERLMLLLAVHTGLHPSRELCVACHCQPPRLQWWRSCAASTCGSG